MQRQARILLIDDDEVDFVITRKLLGKLPEHRYELDWVDTYEAALQAVATNRYDVCLVDYQLGPQTGLDLLREVRSRGSELPMIILTARGDERIDAEAFALGAAGFIDKARLDSDELDRSLRYALRREGLVNDLVKHNAELLHLHRLTEIFLDRDSVNDACRDAAVEIARFTGLPMVAIERYDARRGTLEPLGVTGSRDREGSSSLEVKVEHALAGRVLEGRSPLVEMECSGADRDALEHLDWIWVQSITCISMVVKDEVVGALTLADSQAQFIDSSQVNLAATIASHVGLLLTGLFGRPFARPGAVTGDAREARFLEEVMRLQAWAAAEARRAGLALSWETRAAWPQALDPSDLRQVLGSLLENALASSRLGTLAVRLSEPDRRTE